MKSTVHGAEPMWFLLLSIVLIPFVHFLRLPWQSHEEQQLPSTVCVLIKTASRGAPLQHHLQVSRQEALSSSDASSWGVGEKFSYLMVTKQPSRLSNWIVHTSHCSLPQEAKRRVMLQVMRIFFAQQGSFKDILYYLMKDSKFFYLRPHITLCGTQCPGKERILPLQLTAAFQNLLWNPWTSQW